MRFAVLTSTTLASLAFTTSIAAAQPAASAPTQLPAVPESVDAPRELNPRLALGLSLGVTAAGYASFALADTVDSDGVAIVGLAAIALGPSTGHWYQERIITRGLATRAAGIVAIGYGVAQLDLFCDHDCKDDDLGEAFLIGGLIAFGVGTIDDIVTAPLEASRTNAKSRRRLIQNVSLAPKVSGDRASFVLAGSF
jgi:hypothetical protein